MQAYMHNNAVV